MIRNQARIPVSWSSRIPLRDALVAGVTLNVFNRHADRVKMSNIAQMINVLQAMILTDKAQMLLTPTYHVLKCIQRTRTRK